MKKVVSLVLTRISRIDKAKTLLEYLFRTWTSQKNLEAEDLKAQWQILKLKDFKAKQIDVQKNLSQAGILEGMIQFQSILMKRQALQK